MGMTYTYRIEKLLDEPIVVTQLGADYLMASHTEEINPRLVELMDDSSEELFLIFDVTEASFSLDDVIAGASQATRSATPLLRHPKMRQMVVISRSSMVRLAAKGLNSPIFGKINVKVCDTLDEALAHCRSELTV